MLVLVPAPPTSTCPPAQSLAAPKATQSVNSFLNGVLTRTVRAVAECRAQQAGQLTSDTGLNDFMAALYRVCDGAHVWRSPVLIHLAAVIFSLDAELEAETGGICIPEIQLSNAIQKAQQAAASAALALIETPVMP